MTLFRFTLHLLFVAVVAVFVGVEIGEDIGSARRQAAHNEFHAQMSELGVNEWCHQWRVTHRLSESERLEVGGDNEQ